MLFFRHTPAGRCLAVLALTLGACVGYTGDSRDAGSSTAPSTDNTGGTGNASNGGASPGASGGSASSSGSTGSTSTGSTGGDANASGPTGGTRDSGAVGGGMDASASSGGMDSGATNGTATNGTSDPTGGTATNGTSDPTGGTATSGTSDPTGGDPTGGTSDPTTGGTATGGTSDPTTGGTATGGTSDPTGGTATGGSTGDIELPSCSGLGAPAIPRLGIQTVATGLSLLVHAAQAPGTTDWYLVQKSGLIRVFSNGALLPAAYFDASGLIGQSVDAYDERGLLGLAFHPEYQSNGKAYIMVSAKPDSEHSIERVFELTRQSTHQASPTSKMILELPTSLYNHNGGTLLFDDNNLLYVGTGDGGGACNNDQPGTPQNVSSLFGKILRLDVSKTSAPYAADGNPFVVGGDARVFHYGLRNPFRFTMDHATGDLYIGDVGQDQFEEINLAPAGSSGLNFGWGRFEGTANTCTDQGHTLRAGSTHTAPVFVANRNVAGNFQDYQSIISGIVYRGAAMPSLQGTYFFGDYMGSYMGAMTRCQTGVSPARAIHTRCDGATSACLNTSVLATLAAIVEGNDGEMYLVANGNRLLKVVP